MFLVQNYVEGVRGRTEVINRYRSICRLNVTFHVVLKRSSRIRHQVIKEFCKIQISKWIFCNELSDILFIFVGKDGKSQRFLSMRRRVNSERVSAGRVHSGRTFLCWPNLLHQHIFHPDSFSLRPTCSITSSPLSPLSPPPPPSPLVRPAHMSVARCQLEWGGRFIRLWCRQTVNSLKPANWRLMS